MAKWDDMDTLSGVLRSAEPYSPDTLGAMYKLYSDSTGESMAAVSPERPREVGINYDTLPSILHGERYDHTVPHEFEHVLQFGTQRRYGVPYDENVSRQLQKIQKGTDTHADATIIDSLRNTNVDQPFKDYLSNATKRSMLAYIGGAPDKYWYNLKEQWGALSGLEQATHKDLTTDPVVQKKFFNGDPDLVALYRANSGLRNERLDAKDLPPNTVLPQDYHGLQRPVHQYKWEEDDPLTPDKLKPDFGDTYLETLRNLFK